MSTACLSLSDPGPESQCSPQWKRQWTQRRTGAVCVCVCVCVCACVCVHACTRSYPTPGDLMDCVPPGSSVHGIFQPRNWSGLPFPSLRDLPSPGMGRTPPASPALAGRVFASWAVGQTLGRFPELAACQPAVEAGSPAPSHPATTGWRRDAGPPRLLNRGA